MAETEMQLTSPSPSVAPCRLTAARCAKCPKSLVDPQNSVLLKQYVAEETSPAAARPTAGEVKRKLARVRERTVYSTATEGRILDLLGHDVLLVHVREHQQRVPRVHRSDQRNPTFRSSLFQYRLPKCILYRFILCWTAARRSFDERPRNACPRLPITIHTQKSRVG